MSITGKVNKKKWLITISLFTLVASTALSFSHSKPCASANKQATKLKAINMKKILIIGLDPKTIDFSNPDLVPGLTVEKIEMGMKAEQEKLYSLGFKSEAFLLDLKETDVSKLSAHLKNSKYDGIVIGAGIRVPQNTFLLFEKIINAAHENAPGSKIMFNTLPTTTAEAIQRWL